MKISRVPRHCRKEARIIERLVYGRTKIRAALVENASPASSSERRTSIDPDAKASPRWRCSRGRRVHADFAEG